MLRVLVLVVAPILGIGGAGCADGEEARLTGIKSAVCACKTSACAELAMKDVPHDDVHPTHRTRAIAREMMDCLSKLYEAERPTAEPDTELTDPGSAAPASARTP